MTHSVSSRKSVYPVVLRRVKLSNKCLLTKVQLPLTDSRALTPSRPVGSSPPSSMARRRLKSACRAARSTLAPSRLMRRVPTAPVTATSASSRSASGRTVPLSRPPSPAPVTPRAPRSSVATGATSWIPTASPPVISVAPPSATTRAPRSARSAAVSGSSTTPPLP